MRLRPNAIDPCAESRDKLDEAIENALKVLADAEAKFNQMRMPYERQTKRKEYKVSSKRYG